MMLRKISQSNGNVMGSIEKLEQELEPLKKQRKELMMIIKAMQLQKELQEGKSKEPVRVEATLA